MSNATALDPLLSIQDHDLALDRLRHRRETLVVREELTRARRDAVALDTRLNATRARRDELLREEQRVDEEAQSLQRKASDVESKMYSGEIASPRELQSMQADVEQMKRHQRALEGRELELMEEREPIEHELAEVEREMSALDGEIARLTRERGAAEAEIDTEAAREQAARDELGRAVGPELLGEYERCRTRARGVGIARLVSGTCQGCHLSIPATEIERIKRLPSGTIGHCDNCGCILVP
jgi:predicted  nucleic acid-binding Zn-ribbon protein